LQMPPSRGQELKRKSRQTCRKSDRMPPSRGQELKLRPAPYTPTRTSMPPSRGQELKLVPVKGREPFAQDAPFTGARIETNVAMAVTARGMRMPPSRGQELKPCLRWRGGRASVRCPLHGGKN